MPRCSRPTPSRRRTPTTPRPPICRPRPNAETARINLNYTRITAPITGRIGASTVTEGALVTASQATALATISTLDPIYVDIDQSSAELLALQARRPGRARSAAGGADVTLKLDDGSDYAQNGKLQFTDVTVDPTTGAVRLRAIFPNPDGLAAAGHVCPRHGQSKASIRMASWCRSRASATTPRASPPRWWWTTRTSRACACSRPAAPWAATGRCWTASSPATS